MPNEATERWTVGRLLSWTADFLKKKGSESPRLDAEVLLAHVLEWPRVSLYIHFEDEVGERAKATYRELVRKRSEGEPVAYLIGRKEFFSLPFLVSCDVLIPRPDTETLVVAALDFLKGKEGPRVVDVGTGSGCLALAIAKHHVSARVIATDLSEKAIAIATQNAHKLEVTERVEFRQGDLLTPVVNELPFDLIVSNPPYIPSDDIPNLEPGVRDFEPHLALDGGIDGLRIVERLIKQAASLLVEGGSLILEIGSAQEMPVRSAVEANGNFVLAPTIRDAANHPRVIRAIFQKWESLGL